MLNDLWHWYEQMVNHHFGKVLAALVGGLCAVLLVHQYLGLIQRRKRFSKRDVIADEQWFNRFYPVPEIERNNVRLVLQAISKDIGIEWTQIRPTDHFEDMLKVHGRPFLVDDLEEAELRLVGLADQKGIDGKNLPGFTGTIRSFLDQWVQLCRGEPPANTK